MPYTFTNCTNFMGALASTPPWSALDKGAEVLWLAEVRSAVSRGVAVGRVAEALWCVDQGRSWGCGGWDLLGARVLRLDPELCSRACAGDWIHGRQHPSQADPQSGGCRWRVDERIQPSPSMGSLLMEEKGGGGGTARGAVAGSTAGGAALAGVVGKDVGRAAPWAAWEERGQKKGPLIWGWSMGRRKKGIRQRRR